MNQIYNLAQTIEDDKEVISRLEKHLLNAKNILAAHEQAMERLTTIPEVIVPDNKEKPVTEDCRVSESIPVRRERITPENYCSLGIETGDQVEIIVSADDDFEEDTTYKVVNVDYNTKTTFLELSVDNLADSSCWYWYGCTENVVDELYLIRTTEGSLYK